jgi:hypothetical protein
MMDSLAHAEPIQSRDTRLPQFAALPLSFPLKLNQLIKKTDGSG